MNHEKIAMSLPALLGGAPIRPHGPPSWPPADPAILDVLQQAYRDGWWGKYQAGQCERLEALLRDYHSVAHAFLCGSGNYAVELGLRALNIGAGDEVILADYDYPGNFFSVHAVGATPVLVDVDHDTWNLSLPAVREAVGPATKAIIASHLHGGCVPMGELMDLADELNLFVVEDAAQATGAVIDGHKAGTWGDVGILSFGGSKLLSAGRGGVLLTSLGTPAQRARNHLFRAGNIVCPMSELQAALIVPQLTSLDERNALRWSNVQVLCDALKDVPGVRPFTFAKEKSRPAFYKVGFQFDAAAFGLPRDLLIKAIHAEGFALDEGFEAAHVTRSPKRFRQGSTLTESERAHAGCVMLHHPMFLETPTAMIELAEAWRRIHAHAHLFSPVS